MLVVNKGFVEKKIFIVFKLRYYLLCLAEYDSVINAKTPENHLGTRKENLHVAHQLDKRSLVQTISSLSSFRDFFAESFRSESVSASCVSLCKTRRI